MRLRRGPGLLGLGKLQITRASHVEPDLDGNWWADMGPVGGPVLGPFGTRGERFRRRGGGSGGKPIIESQDPSHDGKKTDGGTLKNLASATMWLLVSIGQCQRPPLPPSRLRFVRDRLREL